MAAKQLRWSLCLAVLLALVLPLLTPGLARAQNPQPQPQSVPAELEPWIDWVRQRDLPPGNCRNFDEVLVCVWPTQASLRLEQDGGSFTLEVAVSEAESLSLIGDDDAWPQDVRVDGKPALVIDGGGIPEVALEAGQHRIEGRFAWRELPDQIHLPEQIAMLELVVEGVEITFPDRSGTVLDIPVLEAEPDEDEAEPEDETEPNEDEPAEPEPDTERIEVSRLLSDGVPLRVTTRIDLRVSGQDRELALPYPLWEDAKLVRIDSNLPVSLDDEQQIVIKLCPGTHYLSVVAELPRAPESLGPPALDAPWPQSEVWVWEIEQQQGAASLGQVALSGGSPVDRTRTHAPESWPEGATYTVTPKTPLRFEVLQRGVAESAPNEISLAREAIFDLAGQGWYFHDEIAGTMNSSSRLDLERGQLGSVIVDGQPQVITVNNEGLPGVELRNPELSLRAQWRQSPNARSLPLSGWSESFERASVEFKLPRGWDLLYISGPGRTSTTWLERWNPLNAILLLGACFAIGFWSDRRAALAALLGLVLLFSASDDGFVPLLVLLVALAGLPRLMQRPSLPPWLLMGLRALWLLGAFTLLAWVLLIVPENLREVWRFGGIVLGDLRVESADEQLSALVVTALLLASLVAAVSWVLTHFARLGIARSTGARLGIVAVILLIIAAFGLATLSRVGGEAQFEDASVTAAAEPPPPTEEYEREEELAQDAQKSGGLYAMRGPGSDENDEDVWGGLSGSEVGEAYGVGGLGLVGTGRGGGGTGEGTIGLGNTGLIGKGGGGGEGSGYGRGSGAGFGGRGKRVPRVRQGKATVQGSLDRDIVRRIVRSHINEVRSCYNSGLAKNPNLDGRVVISFVVTGSGTVGSSLVKETSLADASVGNCIAKAVKRWKFPKPPNGGNVIVTYPFTLSSDGDAAPGGEANGLDAQQPAEPTRYLSSEELPEAPPPEIPQTGEAAPDWNGRRWTVEVDRRVEPGEQLELYLLSPQTNKLLALLRALALAAMSLLLLLAGWGSLLSPAPKDDTDDTDDTDATDATDASVDEHRDPGSRAGKAGAGSVVVALLLSLGLPSLASAAPPQSLLDELEERVNEDRELAPSPDCGDDCTLVPLLEVRIDEQRLTLDAQVHMEAPGIYIVPGPLSAWAPSELSLDGKPAKAVVAYDNKLLVRMEPGIHRVVASGPVAGEELNLSLPLQPKRIEIEVENDSWEVSGLDPRDTATNLQFLRDAAEDDPEGPEGPVSGDDPEQPESSEDEGVSEQARDDSKTSQELPLWLSVTREIEIGPRWTMRTTVRRINAGDTPAKIQVPLLEGEQMIESSRALEDPKATLTLERGEDSVTWSSVLDPRERLVLAAPASDADQGGPKWTESWIFVCGAAWQCNAEGVPPSDRSGSRSVYYPWPGETLEVALFKPTPAEGARLSIDEAKLHLLIGEEGTSASLEATIRTSTVGERTITLPESAHLEAVRVDGKDIPTNKDSAAIRLTFQPGVHELHITWKQDEGWSSSYATPAVSLGGAAINTSVTVSFSDDDHSPIYLRTSGTGFGPQVWLWAWLLALLGVALLLWRLERHAHALGIHDWLLLGVGFPLPVLPLVAGWFLLVGRRRRLVEAAGNEQRYNMVQLGIGLLTLIVGLLALLTARMLLTQPIDTMVHNFYGDELLSWYLDRSDDAMPEGRVLSVPASSWRVLGIAWVAWFGWRCVAWFKWAKLELSAGGWMRWPAPLIPDPVEELTPEQLQASSQTTTPETAAADSEARVTQLEPDPDPDPDAS